MDSRSIVADDAAPTVDQSVLPMAKYKVSVEPILFLYMLGYTLTTVFENLFFVQRTCSFHYPAYICDHIENFKDAREEAQKATSTFLLWNNLLSHLFPVIFSVYIGGWSDKWGRKVPLMFALCGKLWYNIVLTVLAVQDSWPLTYLMYFGTIPSSLTGTDVVIFSSCYSYLSDISSPNERTLRMTILEIAYLCAMPLGGAFGTILFQRAFNGSYALLFALHTALLLLTILWTAISLTANSSDDQLNVHQHRSITVLRSFFNVNLVANIKEIVHRERPPKHKRCMLLCFLAMALYTFQRDEKPFLIFYSQLTFDWTNIQISQFRTFQTSCYVVCMTVGLSLLSRFLKIHDLFIILLGATAHIIARIMFAVAKVPVVFYVGALISGTGPIVLPGLRSLVSKMSVTAERGQLFALLSICENATSFISTPIYSVVYNATIASMPAAIFLVTIATQTVIIIIFSYIILRIKF